MKTPLFIFVLLATLTGSAITFLEWQRHQRQDQQLLAYEQHVQQLLGEVENTSLRRIDTEKQLEQVRATLAEIRSQMTAVSSQLQVAQEKVNPEYEAMEQRICREVRSELQAQRPATPILTNSKTDLLCQISQLDPNEARELMTLQSTYGGFLQLLNADDARLEVIVDGLSNMIAEQNQARMDLMLQMQQDNTNANPRQIRREIQTISSPESQSEALSFILTDEEMALFEQYQASQPQRAFTRSVFTSTGGINVNPKSGVFISAPPNGGLGIINYEIITAEPN
ncbi:MAG: hypothetical protein EXR84_00290 [Gammaproteobacteria bacterium]|nr:hypothetical protein [Gammaproteobacteria bacterium]